MSASQRTSAPAAACATADLISSVVLREACQKLGAVPVDLGLSYQIVCRFEVLPKIPILLLFNDEDEEFPAQGSLLFQEKAAGYLDMECLAILGWLLTDALIQSAGKSIRTVM